MRNTSKSPGFPKHSDRAAIWLSLLIVAYVTLRKLVTGIDSADLPLTIGFLLAFTLLFATRRYLTIRFRGYLPAYFLLQVVIVQALGFMQPYEDTWSLLYIPLGFQAFHEYPRRTALALGSVFSFLLLATLALTIDWISSLGFGLFYIVVGIFFIAYDLQYVRSEAARQESQELLTELQQAHARLKEYTAQVEELAVTQEHEQITHYLHDSVSQIIFSITLEAQSARLLLEKDPGQVPPLLDRLQELTSRALSQMRALISQWRSA